MQTNRRNRRREGATLVLIAVMMVFLVGMVAFEELEGMNADPIVLQEVIADPDDRDRIHAEVPRRSIY